MKHIKPKAITVIKTSFDHNGIPDLPPEKRSRKKANDFINSKSYNDEMDLAMITSNGHVIFGFDYLHNEKKKIIPELDPSVIYFSSAQLFSKMIYDYRNQLIRDTASLDEIMQGKTRQSVDDIMKRFEVFFQFASSYIIMLNASLEAFVNKMIPINYTYTAKDGIEKDFEWIHRQSIDFKTKKIIPNCTKKDYVTEYKSKYQEILAVKKFRNELIHLSPKNKITNTKYKDFYRKVIDFNYSEAIYSIRHYINYHQENLIEECPCHNEFYFDIIKK